MTTLVLASVGWWPNHLRAFGDNDAFLAVVDALQQHDLSRVTPQQFWGFPYLISLVTSITRLPAMVVLLLCSWVPALAAIALAAELWGNRVAAWMAIVSFPWVQRMALGGNEPLFMCLLLGAFVAARRDRQMWAMLLAALATTVRPIGIVAVCALCVVLIARRQVTATLGVLAIFAGVVIAYAAPLWIAYGDPMANVSWYRSAAWAGRTVPLTWPFMPIVRGWSDVPPSMPNAIKTIAWIVLVVTGYACWLRGARWRALWQCRPVELVSAIAALWFVLCYNAPFWSSREFARFAIPLAPFALQGLEPWLPTRRGIVWPIALASGVLAAVSLI